MVREFLVEQAWLQAKADRNMCRTDGERKKTLEVPLDMERFPVQWTCVVRFTLFPPQDNVIFADGTAGTSAVFLPIRCLSLGYIPGLIRAACGLELR
jgi:uncharacterized membrane protein YqaE (UPF0057 family)